MSVVSASRLVASRGSARTCAPGRRSALGGTDAPWSSSRRVARRARVRATRRASQTLSVGARSRRAQVWTRRWDPAPRRVRSPYPRDTTGVTSPRQAGAHLPRAHPRASVRCGVGAASRRQQSAEHGRTVLEPGRANLGAGSSRGGVALTGPPGAVEAAFVGRIEGLSAAAALGGLAVSSTVFNFSFKLFSFLCPSLARPRRLADRSREGSGRTGRPATNGATPLTRFAAP